MSVPVMIGYRGVESSEWLSELIKTEVRALEELDVRLTRCRVVISQPHRHHLKGRLFAVRAELGVPRETLVANTEHDEHAGAAVRDAFKALRRQLESIQAEARQHG
jgi:ribosome-associated translation inhibitor RaiA